MAQINLLKQSASTSSNNLWQIVPKIFTRLLMLVLAGLVVYYGWLYFHFKSIDSQILTLKSQINSDQQSALTVPGRSELLTRQQQLKQLNDLIGAHLYFSSIFPQLAADTLSTASYTSLQADSAGLLTLTVTVPSLADLDKYLQVFNLPDVNKNFSNVRISSFQKVQETNATSVTFQVTMQYNGALIQYHSAANSLNSSN